MKQAKKNPLISKKKLIALYQQAIREGIPLQHVDERVSAYLARTEVTEKVEDYQVKNIQQVWSSQMPASIRLFSWIIPTIFVLIGILLIGSAALPIGFHLIKTAPQLKAAEILSPVPQDQILDVMPLVIAPVSTISGTTKTAVAPIILNIELDYTNLTNWFNEAKPELKESKQTAFQYLLEIPKLKLTEAKVVIGGTNLNQSLIQYPGTANPGEAGSPVIFGHSVLRQFYNPSLKNPNRYNSIFSTIMTLSKGDRIFIKDGSVTYEYMVIDKTEVKPEDIFILKQRYDAKLLKLVTCVPEGTYLRRGVVTAQLVE